MTDALTLAGEDDALRATFLPTLGMVCSSLQYDGDELLELLGGPQAYEQRGSTFGIPLLHPWANRLSNWSYDAGGHHVELDRDSPLTHVDGATGLPIHGLLAASPLWTVTSTGPAMLNAELDFGADADLLAAFPFPHRLELQATVRRTRLELRLTVIPTGTEPVPISFGFHPYLQVPGETDRREWTVELPVCRQALLDGHGIPTGAHEQIGPGALSGALGDRAFDDAFDELPDREPRTFAVADRERRITVDFGAGYPVAQVYAPEASRFICFEPMTAPVDALTTGHGLRWVEPGDRFCAEFTVGYEPLGGSDRA